MEIPLYDRLTGDHQHRKIAGRRYSPGSGGEGSPFFIATSAALHTHTRAQAHGSGDAGGIDDPLSVNVVFIRCSFISSFSRIDDPVPPPLAGFRRPRGGGSGASRVR